jgi:tetratricopeptide (TPR) repeat protein
VPGNCKGGGRPAGEDWAYENLGLEYNLQGNYAKAINCHAQDLAIAKEVVDWSEEGQGYANLGPGHMYLNECDTAVAYHKAQSALAISLKLAHMQSNTAMDMGVTLTLHVRALRTGRHKDTCEVLRKLREVVKDVVEPSITGVQVVARFQAARSETQDHSVGG